MMVAWVAWITRLLSTRTIWILILLNRTCLLSHRFMMIRQRSMLCLRIYTWSLARLILWAVLRYITSMALCRWGSVPGNSSAISVSPWYICRRWLPSLALFTIGSTVNISWGDVFWIWINEIFQILLVHLPAIIAIATCRWIIDVVIASHVGRGRLLSHTRSRHISASSGGGNIGAQNV